MRRALVCGAGGFIGQHLCRLLKERGYRVRGVDLEEPEFSPSPADEFLRLDLREAEACRAALRPEQGRFDEVYQLAADMGGMGFIDAAECEVLVHNALINLQMIRAAADAGVGRYFFSSSACVYRDQPLGDHELDEDDAYPALPDNEYGWEKLYSERVALAFARNRGLEVRVARFQNCYGPEGAWQGGREKAPAALCRKVALAEEGGEIEVWGDGSATRPYVYVRDLVEAVHGLVRSDLREPTNIGGDELTSVRQLVDTIARVAGKSVRARWVAGPVGVQARYHATARIRSTGWKPRHDLESGLRETYRWVAAQVRRAAREAPAGRSG
jgi:nucleoside-diphosphate-sugar epimerase